MSVIDRLFGRGADAAARALIEAARSAAPEVARASGVDADRGHGAALLLAKLCFDRAAPQSGRHHHGGLAQNAAASKRLYPAIAAALGGTAVEAGQRYVELADAVRRGLESRASMSGAAIVARELRRSIAPPDAAGDVPPALIGCVEHLIRQFNAIAARELGVRVSRKESTDDGR